MLSGKFNAMFYFLSRAKKSKKYIINVESTTVPLIKKTAVVKFVKEKIYFVNIWNIKIKLNIQTINNSILQ